METKTYGLGIVFDSETLGRGPCQKALMLIEANIDLCRLAETTVLCGVVPGVIPGEGRKRYCIAFIGDFNPLLVKRALRPIAKRFYRGRELAEQPLAKAGNITEDGLFIYD